MKQTTYYMSDAMIPANYTSMILIAVLVGAGFCGIGFWLGDSFGNNLQTRYDEGYSNGLTVGFNNGTTVGFNEGNSSHFSYTRNIHPIIDGNIDDEWKFADYKIQQYFVVNKSFNAISNSSDADGYNYLYVGQDQSNLYICADLVSDQTSDNSSEWFSVFLNTMERQFGANMTDNATSSSDWTSFEKSFYEYRNNGTESLVLDAETNTTLPYFFNPTIAYGNVFDTSFSSVNQSYGENAFASIWNDTYYDDADYYLTQSHQYGLESTIYDKIVIDLTLNLTEVFAGNYPEEYKTQYFQNIKNFELNLTAGCGNSISFIPNMNVEYAKLSVLNNETLNADLPIGLLNEKHYNISSSAYADGLLHIKFEIYNETMNPDYIIYAIDSLNFVCDIPQSDSLYGSSTINQYSIVWNFASSPNSPIAHRIVELSIPITQLEGYNATGVLNIYVQGYGTLSLFGSQVKPSYYFGIGNSLATLTFFFWTINIYTPYSPDWSKNYYPLHMGLTKPILI